MQFLFQPLHHLRPIRAWVAARAGKLELDAASFVLRVSAGPRSLTLIPRFSIRTPNGLAYTNTLGDEGGFVGWLPYEVRQWPAAVDKLLFKQACAEHGVRSPPWSTEAAAPTFDFLIKGRQGSFGKGITGPHPAGSVPGPAGLPADCFVEAFKFGRAAKAWYFRDRPLAIEVLDPPHVLGDGQRSIETLLSQVRGSFDRAYSAQSAAAVLAWQGLRAADVPAAGRKVWIGFKYVTDYDAPVFRDRDMLQALAAPVRDQFVQAGPAFSQLIPARIADSVYTIDAVIDTHGAVWFLEMNCNPMVHPKVYAAVLDALLGAGGPGEGAPV